RSRARQSRSRAARRESANGGSWLASRRLRPHDACVLFRHRANPSVVELLHTLAVERLARIDVALRIGRDRVHRVELAWHAAAVAEARDHRERRAIENPDLLIRAVGDVEVLLPRVA